ncbi:hypothetical protein GGX14DRAFT_348318 [Mycena pura]|uniref:Uncharacterized protein n=1 Tax=Mycena pura TaxID=153505 RepID=A0AAD6YRS5_9AGAR|nr:hypothetical protein GGX14DRAFT_348318 [Mycena pura]
MQQLNVPSTSQPTDGLFFERLDAFCLSEIKAFAERERRPLEETRQHVAEWHSRYLFSPHATEHLNSTQDRIAQIQSVLSDVSRILESLCNASGVQSFLLAVDPSDATGFGFLGGSVLGREYWRGLRGGGDGGAKAFKVHCFKNLTPPPVPSNAEAPSFAVSSSAPAPKHSSARSVKTDLYDGVRKALRTASGVRNAEMKWTNPALLHTYGVCLVGWPPSIPAQNPSSLKANQNKQLLEALKSGTMHFVRTLSTPNEPHVDPLPEPPPSAEEEESSFAWAIQFEDPVAVCFVTQRRICILTGIWQLSANSPNSSVGESAGTSDFLLFGDGGRPTKRPRLDELPD